ncbi:hypothetical protein BH11PLA2_BH11PLA2_10110 [soil metagenome]
MTPRSKLPLSADDVVRVLLVDDDEDDYHLTRAALSDIPHRRFRVDWEQDYTAALERICQEEHDVYLIDYRLGLRTGIELLQAVHQRGCDGPTILLTGQGQYEVDEAAYAAGADDYLEKSRLDSVVLERMIRYAIQQHAHEATLEATVAARTAELEAANVSLRDADRRKNEFLATLAHELRNPLTPIRNALRIQTLMADQPAAVQSARLVIERQVGQMVHLIDDLVDASRFSRGKLQLKHERLDLKAVFEMALETSRPVFDNAGVTLTTEIPAEDLPILGDRVRLVQLFANILNNAAKYTPAGGRATLSVRRDESTITITFVDTGVGIPSEQLNNVFLLFTQIDRTLNRSENGLGIGLALVKGIVELHDGTVRVTSPGLNRGSTFTVTLPVAA